MHHTATSGTVGSSRRRSRPACHARRRAGSRRAEAQEAALANPPTTKNTGMT